jgi:hypothetical protein
MRGEELRLADAQIHKKAFCWNDISTFTIGRLDSFLVGRAWDIQYLICILAFVIGIFLVVASHG